MSTIKVQELVVGSTVDVTLHHNYPLEITKTRTGLAWVVSQNKGGAKSKFTTRLVGRLGSNDLTKKEFQIYGSPYSGTGLGTDFLSSGQDYAANATIPWNYVMSMWVLTQKEIPDISIKHGRLAVLKTAVIF